MSTRILVPVDGSPSSRRAVELVAAYQGAKGALRVRVLNAQTPVAVTYPEAAMVAQSVDAALLETGRGVADAAAAQLRAAGIAAETAVRLGLPAGTITAEAEAERPALVVMGTRGEGAVRGFALGSVALRVAHGSPVPVCMVHPDACLPKAFGKSLRVLLAVDGSEPAQRAAQALGSWRSWLGELDIQIAYVQPPLTLAQAILPPHDDLVEQWSTREAEAAARAARELFTREGVKHHLHISTGDSATEIVHLAEQAGCELIALGTRGRGAMHHAFVGSVALKVAAASPLPVLLSR